MKEPETRTGRGEEKKGKKRKKKKRIFPHFKHMTFSHAGASHNPIYDA